MTPRNLAAHVSTRRTPQSQKIPGSAQVPNSAGGYSFQVDKWTRLHRWLVLGSEGGSYYANERDLTVQNVECLQQCADEDFPRALATVVRVSDEGLAPKNDYAILALAILSARPAPQSTQALAELNKVCRIGTHLFQFIEYARHFRGRGRALKTALQRWYDKPAKDLAFQVTKYASRKVGDKTPMTHRDVLRLCKPRGSKFAASAGKDADAQRDAVLNYVVGKPWQGTAEGDAVEYLVAVEAAKAAKTAKDVIPLIEKYRLPREVLPTQLLNDPAVWEVLLPGMPFTGLLRNLGKMTAVGLIKPLSSGSKAVVEKLGDAAYLAKGRAHPMAVLIALSIYRTGRGLKGALSWHPDPRVIDALDGAFYAAFRNVEPTGKNRFVALDISGSMQAAVAGTFLSARDCSAAMAMVTVKTEPNTFTAAFTAGGKYPRRSMHSHIGGQYAANIAPVDFSCHSRLDDAVAKVSWLPFGGTDCSLPMVMATAERLEVDAFEIYTDSETWYGDIHPVQALREYREKMGRPAKLIVVGMCSNEFTIADPADGDSMDVVGFDASAPAVMANFVRGQV